MLHHTLLLRRPFNMSSSSQNLICKASQEYIAPFLQIPCGRHSPYESYGRTIIDNDAVGPGLLQPNKMEKHGTAIGVHGFLDCFGLWGTCFTILDRHRLEINRKM